MRSKRAAISVWIHLSEIEIIGSLGVRAELWIIFIRREYKRSSASPTPHQLRRYPFLLLGCFAIFPKKLSKRAHMLFHPQISDITAVMRKNRGLRHSCGGTVFIRIPEK